jgi:hypothetical protein
MALRIRKATAMRKIKSALGAAVIATGLLGTLGTGTASAAPLRVYTRSVFDEYAVNAAGEAGYTTFGTYSTYSQTQIWINGQVTCSATPGWAAVSWCGVGGGNGTAKLNIGVNLKGRNWTAYSRANLYANAVGCYVWGGTSNGGGTANSTWPANTREGGEECEVPQ